MRIRLESNRNCDVVSMACPSRSAVSAPTRGLRSMLALTGTPMPDARLTFASPLPGPGAYVVSGELVTRIGGSFVSTPFDFFVDIR